MFDLFNKRAEPKQNKLFTNRLVNNKTWLKKKGKHRHTYGLGNKFEK